MKIGLYSISCSGTWYNDVPALSVEACIDLAKEYGYEGVEIDLKRPHGSPIDLDDKRCAQIKKHAQKQGIEICGVAANNDFTSPVPEHIENELLMVKEQIRVAKALGAPQLRLFVAWRGITYKNGIATYEITSKHHTFYDALDYEIRQRAVDCFKECAAWAKEAGVMLALQNHSPVIVTYKDMLDFVKWVDSPYFKCCFDAPNCAWNEKEQSDDFIENAVREVGDLELVTHASGEFVENNGEISLVSFDPILQPVVTNYPALIRTLKEIGYNGYINYEYCHVPFRNGKVLGFDYIKQQIRLAQIYLRNLIES